MIFGAYIYSNNIGVLINYYVNMISKDSLILYKKIVMEKFCDKSKVSNYLK